MVYLVYALVICTATSLGAVAGLGGGVIIKPLLDLVGYHDATTINIYSSIAVFVMCVVSLARQVQSGFSFDLRTVLFVAFGSLIGGAVGDKAFCALTDSIDKHLVKATQSSILALVLFLILLYTLTEDDMPRYKLRNPGIIFACGFVLGSVAVFLGIGGGPLNMAALSLFFSLGTKEGSVYSLAIIFFSQMAKLVLSAANGTLATADLSFVPFVVIPAIAGGLIGTFGNRRLSETGVRRMYIAVMALLPVISLYNCITSVAQL